jgi:RHS repeat-associated protein
MAQVLAHYRKIYSNPDALEFFYNDNLGSTRVAINKTGNPIDSYSYSSWGVVTQLTGFDKYASFTGKGYDNVRVDYSNPSFIYFNARYYDPKMGRFVTEDPSKEGDGWYGYCDNDPINNIDITGMQSITQAITGDLPPIPNINPLNPSDQAWWPGLNKGQSDILGIFAEGVEGGAIKFGHDMATWIHGAWGALTGAQVIAQSRTKSQISTYLRGLSNRDFAEYQAGMPIQSWFMRIIEDGFIGKTFQVPSQGGILDRPMDDQMLFHRGRPHDQQFPSAWVGVTNPFGTGPTTAVNWATKSGSGSGWILSVQTDRAIFNLMGNPYEMESVIPMLIRRDEMIKIQPVALFLGVAGLKH